MSQFRGETITDLEALVDEALAENIPCICPTMQWTGDEMSESTCERHSGIQPTPEARAEPFREFAKFLEFEPEPIEVLISRSNRRLMNMMANNCPKLLIENEIKHLIQLLGAQGEQA